MLDFGESRCVLDADFVKCDDRFPPYVDLDDLMLSLSNVFRSGVKGDELLFDIVAVRVRGEGVKGIRPPAVREEKSPMWDLMGVDTAVAILQYLGYDLGRKTNKCIDR
jgi:hypothetical protein